MRRNHLFELFRAEKCRKADSPASGLLPGPLEPVRGNHLEVFSPHLGFPWTVRNYVFELVRAENAEKLMSVSGLKMPKSPHLGSSLEPWSPVRGNHLFELGSSLDPWSPVRGNHLFELFRAENAEKLILPHLGSSLDPGARAAESPF